MEQFEKEKIQGAIRTDFILSAEIIVIALGTVADKGLLTQSIVVSGVAFVMTVGVYGAVAAIVKMDDVGLYLLQTAKEGKRGTLKRFVGSALLSFAPRLMKTLTLVGTAAMFLVGGGILVHGLSFIHHWIETLTPLAESVPLLGNTLGWSLPFVVNAIAGVVVGGIAMAAIGMLLMVVKIFRR